MRRLLLLAPALVVVACGKSTGEGAAPPPGDAAAADAPADDAAEAGWPSSPRSPSPKALSDLVGLAAGLPLDASAASTAQRTFVYGKLAEAHFHRLRRDFLWNEIEPARGTFVYTDYDRLVSEALAHSVDLLALLDYGVPWATSVQGADDYYPPDDPADFAAFANAVATRYAGQVHDYEVWNEPNAGFRFWKPTFNGDPVKYGTLCQAAARAIAVADPTAQVAYGGTVFMGLLKGPDFVAQSFAANPQLAPALNAFAMHAYSIYPPIRGPESDVAYEVPLLDKIATMSGELAQAGARPVPIWITEIGWPTTSDDPADQQARYTVRAIVIGALGGADGVFLYTMSDGPHPEAFPPEDAFGLVGYHADFSDGQTPPDKPAFTALKALLGALGSYAVTKRITASPDDLWVVELAGAAGDAGGKRAWIAWRALDGSSPTPVQLPAPVGPLVVTHVDGTTQQDQAGSDGYMLSVGPDPVIVAPP
jgi:hypothetical protein